MSTGSSRVSLFYGLKGEWLIVLASLIWGVAFYFQKTAMESIGPLLFIGLRGLVAAVALLPFALSEQNSSENASTGIVPIACFAGVVFFLAGTMQQIGLVTATVTNTGFLTAIYVVATPLLYWVIKRRAPSRITGFSVILAFVGVWALSGGSISGLSSGDKWVAVSSVFWALLIITTSEASRWSQPLTYTCIKFFIVAVLGIGTAVMLEPINLESVLEASESIIYVGVLSSALTFGMMAIALKTVSASRASVLLTLETVFAAAAGYLLLGERLTLQNWTGAALIICAVLVLRIRSTD
ncbi:MAG: DMT family transporter [Granulosicoccus sp.]